MDFFKQMRMKENEMLNKLPLNELIERTHLGNLKILKEKVDSNNVNSPIISEDLITYTPLEYAIKKANEVSFRYFISIGGDLSIIEKMSELCKDILDINFIKVLVEEGIDFNQFKYSIKLHEFSGSLRLRFRDRLGEQTLGFYSLLLLNDKVRNKEGLLKSLEELGIKTRKDDFFSPFELGIIGYNTFDILKKLKENSRDKLEDIFSLVLTMEFFDKKIIEYLELFVDEFNLDLTNNAQRRAPLITEIYNGYRSKNEVMFEAFKRLNSYDGFEHMIYSTLNEEQINRLENFYIPPEKRMFSLSDYKGISECLREIKKLDRKQLNHIVFTDELKFVDKVALIDEYISLGGDINVLFEVEDLSPDSTNANILYYALFNSNSYIGIDQLIPVLIEKGAKFEQNGWNVLIPAIYMCKIPIIKLLLNKGVNPHAINTNGNDTVIDALFLWNSYDFVEEERIKIIELLLKAGLDMNTIVNYDGKEMSLLEKLCLIDNSNKLLAYLFHKNIGDFTRGNIPLSILSSTAVFDTEAKKKMIDFVPNYEFEKTYDSVKGTYNIYNFLFNYNLKEREKDELINHLIDNYPELKANYLQVGPPMNNLFGEIKLETFVKVIKHNSHLVDKTYIIAGGEQSLSYIHSFVLRDSFVEALQSKEGIEEIKTIIKLLVELGVDINKPLQFLDRLNSETHTDSCSILEEVIAQMVKNNKFCPEVIECFLDNGFRFQEGIGSLDETPIMGFHRSIKEHNLVREEMIVELFELLNKREKIDFNYRNKFNDNLLLAYSKSCFYKVVEWLLEKGANIDVIGGFDNSPPLHKAISNYSDVLAKPRALTVEVLLKYGANIEEVCNADHFTPLMSAAYYGAKECVKVLVEAGANVNALSPEGRTASICAVIGNASYDFNRVESNQSDILRLLVEHGANINYPSIDDFDILDEVLPPLHLAIYGGKKEVFETLISLGADINIQENRAGMTPIMYAVEYGEMYFVKRLIELGVDFSLKSNYNENVLTSCLYRTNENEGKKLYKYFRNLGVEITESKSGGDLSLNLLHIASSISKVEWIKEFSKEININLEDTNGNSPLIWAISSNYNIEVNEREKAVKEIISLGANINQGDKLGRTPLLWAIMLNHITLFKILVEAGASIPQSILAGEELGVDAEIIEKLKMYINGDELYN